MAVGLQEPSREILIIIIKLQGLLTFDLNVRNLTKGSFQLFVFKLLLRSLLVESWVMHLHFHRLGVIHNFKYFFKSLY